MPRSRTPSVWCSRPSNGPEARSGPSASSYEQGLLFPRRLRTGPNKGELLWAPPQHARILQVLHNPRYAGAFVYGRTRTRHLPDGGTTVIKIARAEWQFVMPGLHQGYIDWERFEVNQRRLADNARAFGGERRSGPPREGPALLQGRVLCGLCGERMGVHYSRENGQTVPIYVCQETAVRRAGKTCQSVPGKVVDPAVTALLIEMMTPMTLAVSLEVQRELEARAAETDALRRQHVERLRYECRTRAATLHEGRSRQPARRRCPRSRMERQAASSC